MMEWEHWSDAVVEYFCKTNPATWPLKKNVIRKLDGSALKATRNHAVVESDNHLVV